MTNQAQDLLAADIQVSEEIMDVRREAGNPCVFCPTCGSSSRLRRRLRPQNSPRQLSGRCSSSLSRASGAAMSKPVDWYFCALGILLVAWVWW